ncbi:MAG: protein kinase, partial [Planctomycetota bacterium]
LENHPDFKELIKELIKEAWGASGNPIDASSTGPIQSIGVLPLRLGDFNVLRPIGAGATSEIFEAEQISLKRRVALKILPRTMSLSEKAVERFRREAEVIAKLDHPGIVKVLTLDCQKGMHFIAEELVEGSRTLAHLFPQKTGDILQVRDYFRHMTDTFRRIAEALQHVHERGIIHRDVKPSNILITLEGTPKISDFGLARFEGMASIHSSNHSGTVFYKSPEQVSGEGIDFRTDIFSLGSTFYEALTLKRPFPGEISEKIENNILTGEPTEMRRIDRRIPRELCAICGRAMERYPEKRYSSMEEFADDLKRYLAGEPLSPETMGWHRRTVRWVRKHKVALITAAIISWVAACVILWSFITVKNNFLPVNEAFPWQYQDRAFISYGWGPNIDPEDPSGIFYSILSKLELEVDHHGSWFQNIDTQLATLMNSCRQRGDVHLLNDAEYLYAYCLRKHAENAPPEERRKFIEKGECILGNLNFFNPFSAETLFWRDNLETSFRNGLRLNSRHYIVSLYNSINLFVPLYKGGDRRVFDDCIKQLEETLNKRPQNRTALSLLGRVLFYYSRTFWDFSMIARAEEVLKRALEETGSDPCGMIYTTLGQIRILVGDFSKARVFLIKSLNEVTNRPKSQFLQNVFCNLGRVCLCLGDAEGAFAYLEKAEELCPEDVHVQLALADFYLYQGSPDEAEMHASIALISGMAAPYLYRARCATARGDTDEAINQLLLMCQQQVIHCPRDFCLGCILFTTIPERKGRKSLADVLITRMKLDASRTRLYQSALAAFYFLHSDYTQTCQILQNCLDHSTISQEAICTYPRMMTACDFYFLSMALYLNTDLDPSSRRERAMKTFLEAETIRRDEQASHSFIEYMDIFERVRCMAAETLDVKE